MCFSHLLDAHGREAEGERGNVGGEGGGGRGGQVGEQPLTQPDVHLGHGEKEGGGLLGAAGVPSLEPLDLLQGIAGEEAPALGQLVQVPDLQKEVYIFCITLIYIFYILLFYENTLSCS